MKIGEGRNKNPGIHVDVNTGVKAVYKAVMIYGTLRILRSLVHILGNILSTFCLTSYPWQHTIIL